MEKLIYTWEQQIEDTNLICEKIAEDNFPSAENLSLMHGLA